MAALYRRVISWAGVNYLLILFFLGVGFPLCPEIFLIYFSMILQRIRIIVGDAGFEPGT